MPHQPPPLTRAHALTALLEDLIAVATGHPATGQPATDPGRLARDLQQLLDADADHLLALAYLSDERGGYWPVHSDPAQLWRALASTLLTPAPRPVTGCPSWCQEHPTATRHTVEEDLPGQAGYTVTHRRSYGPHLSVELRETTLVDGPTITDPEGPGLLLLPDHLDLLDSTAARTLASDLLEAADHLDDLSRDEEPPR